MTPLQQLIERAIAQAPAPREHYDRLIQRKTGKSGKPLFDIQRGRTREPKIATLRLIADVLKIPFSDVLTAIERQSTMPAGRSCTERSEGSEPC